LKKFYALVCLVFVAFNLTIIGFAHPGGTDGSGGHYRGNSGEYHYHHGHSAHQHPNGVCPYEETYEEPEPKWDYDEDDYDEDDYAEKHEEDEDYEEEHKEEKETSTLGQVIDGVIEFAKELGVGFAVIYLIYALVCIVEHFKDIYYTKNKK
jgi:hypothetical protein